MKTLILAILATALVAGCGEPRLGNRGLPTASGAGAEPKRTTMIEIDPGSPMNDTSVSDGSGRIDGTVADALGEPVAGVTIVVSGTGISGTQSAITDADGTYRIPLPAGRYEVTFYYGDSSSSREVDVEGGKRTPVRATVSQ